MLKKIREETDRWKRALEQRLRKDIGYAFLVARDGAKCSRCGKPGSEKTLVIEHTGEDSNTMLEHFKLTHTHCFDLDSRLNELLAGVDLNEELRVNPKKKMKR